LILRSCFEVKFRLQVVSLCFIFIEAIELCLCTDFGNTFVTYFVLSRVINYCDNSYGTLKTNFYVLINSAAHLWSS